MGRFINQGSDHSHGDSDGDSDRDSRGGETLLGKFVTMSPDGISHQTEFGIVRTSDASSAVEKLAQLTDTVLRLNFTQNTF